MKSCVESGVENICHAPLAKMRFIYKCMRMSMCKKTLSVFGSGSSFLFLDSPVSADFISPLLTVEHEPLCEHDLVYLFSQYFLSPFSALFFNSLP